MIGNWIIDIVNVRNGVIFYKFCCVVDLFDLMEYFFKNVFCRICNNIVLFEDVDRFMYFVGDYKIFYR